MTKYFSGNFFHGTFLQGVIFVGDFFHGKFTNFVLLSCIILNLSFQVIIVNFKALKVEIKICRLANTKYENLAVLGIFIRRVCSKYLNHLIKLLLVLALNKPLSTGRAYITTNKKYLKHVFS